jgi:hypothetical protein
MDRPTPMKMAQTWSGSYSAVDDCGGSGGGGGGGGGGGDDDDD